MKVVGRAEPGLSPGRSGSCATGATTPERLNVMPWSNQSGGGGRRGGGGPWGQGPSGGPQHQPDLEELLKRSQDKLKQVMPGGTGLPGSFMFLLAVVAAAVVAFYAFTFRVNPDELGVVMRFGKPIRSEPPGLHFRLPYPIEEVRLPKVTRQNIIEVGMRSAVSSRGFAGGVRDVPEESLMLTGDENIVDVDFVVFWRIKDAQAYLFNIQNPEVTVKEVAESAMREIVGQNNIQPILTEARQKTEQAVQKLMQDVLDYLSRRHPHRPGAAAEGRPADAGDRRVPRCAGGPRRPGAPAERGVLLCQSRRAGGARRGRAHPAGRQSLQGADGSRGDRTDGALPQGLRRVQEGARGDAQAHVPRDHGARARRHRQDHPRQQERAGRRAVPAARSAAKEARKGPTDGTSTLSGPRRDRRRARRGRLLRAVHRAS